MDALLAAGAFVDATDAEGQTPLCAAAVQGRAEAVERLLKAGRLGPPAPLATPLEGRGNGFETYLFNRKMLNKGFPCLMKGLEKKKRHRMKQEQQETRVVSGLVSVEK